MTRTIAVVTTSRADYGIYLPVLRRIQKEPGLRLRLMVGGMHWLPGFGNTFQEIEKDGFSIDDRVLFPMDGDASEEIAQSMAAAVSSFAACYHRQRPDLLLVLGDRFEMHAAALASLPFKIPIAHLHGGELTRGAMDDCLRHGITKMAHLHFAATKQYAARVAQMGEEPWRITVSGAPALDRIRLERLYSLNELSARFNLCLDQPPVLVTFHPVTLELEQTRWQIAELLRALEHCPHPIVFTATNADTSNNIIREAVSDFVKRNGQAHFVLNCGAEYYFSMLASSLVMVGNSSSGIVEAASFGLPVVNIGTRQEGRLKPQNVIDVGYSSREITEGMQKAFSDSFRSGLRGIENPYGDGHAAERIVDVLKKVSIDQKLFMKKFITVP